MRISRREFVKSVTASGIALTMSRLAIAEEPSFAEREILPGRHRWNPAAGGRGRIDAVPKVTAHPCPRAQPEIHHPRTVRPVTDAGGGR